MAIFVKKVSFCRVWPLIVFTMGLFFSSHTYATPHIGEISRFIIKVLETNPSIQAAKSNVLAAKARQQASSQPLYNPEISIEKEEAIDNTEAIGVSQTIDWANKRGAREHVGVANAMVAQAELAYFSQQLISETLGALARYQFQTQALTLAKKRVLLLHKFVSLTRRRHASGDVARIDLDLAQLAYSEAVAQQTNEEVKVNQALQQLRAITGINQKRWPQLPPRLPKPTSGKINTERLLEQLPSVHIFNQQYRAAQARIKLAEREKYPDPTIGLVGGRNYGQSENRKLFSVTLTIPLYIRNTYRAQVDAANYDAIEAEGKRTDTVRRVRAEVISSAERYGYLYHALIKWQHASGKPLGDGVELIERLWKAGEMNTTDYLVQLKQRVDSQIAGVELRGNAWDAWIEWLRVSGQVERWTHVKA